MFTLETKALLPGDIVLTAQDQFASRKIRKVTSSGFSHAILYVGDGSYIHSDGDGVHADNTQRLLFAESAHAKAYRLRTRNTLLMQKICAFARSEVGKQYSVPEALKSTVRRGSSPSQPSNRQFCSRLVAQAYAYVGIFLVPNPDYCYPRDVGCSDLLCLVEDCVRKATAVELRVEASDNPLKRQAQATNFILAEVRRLSGKDIQTFDQLVDYLLADGQHDNAITEAVRQSGYLDLWKYDVARNGWRYDSATFLNLPIPREEKLELAKSELVAAEQQLTRFQFMYRQYMTLLGRSKLRYFGQALQLYLTLIDWVKIRVAAAQHVLDNA